MALDAAARSGYRICEDALGGCSGGACQVKGQKWLLLDPELSSRDRLQSVLDALAGDAGIVGLDLPAPLARVLRGLRAA